MLTHRFRVPSLLLVLSAFGWSASADAAPKKAKEPPAEEVNLDEEAGEKKDKDAAEKADEEGAKDESASGDAEEGEGSEGEDEKKAEGSDASAASVADDSIVEDPNKTYYFVGARARAVVVPAFIIEAFGDGGEAVVGPMIGAEFGIRKDGFEYLFAAAFTSYPMTDVPFKAPTDPEEAMELVTSELKVIYLTADFYWSKEFSPAVQFIYGGGAGLGFVFGNLYRSQAYKQPDGTWAHCPGPITNMADPLFAYCSPDPELAAEGKPQHYQGYSEPSWFNGGSKPVIMPWLAVQAGLRFKLHRHFATRVDLGIGLGQVFLGLGADYGL